MSGLGLRFSEGWESFGFRVQDYLGSGFMPGLEGSQGFSGLGWICKGVYESRGLK